MQQRRVAASGNNLDVCDVTAAALWVGGYCHVESIDVSPLEAGFLVQQVIMCTVDIHLDGAFSFEELLTPSNGQSGSVNFDPLSQINLQRHSRVDNCRTGTDSLPLGHGTLQSRSNQGPNLLGIDSKGQNYFQF
jgi:hypothetical protein